MQGIHHKLGIRKLDRVKTRGVNRISTPSSPHSLSCQQQETSSCICFVHVCIANYCGCARRAKIERSNLQKYIPSKQSYWACLGSMIWAAMAPTSIITQRAQITELWLPAASQLPPRIAPWHISSNRQIDAPLASAAQQRMWHLHMSLSSMFPSAELYQHAALAPLRSWARAHCIMREQSSCGPLLLLLLLGLGSGGQKI